jgi:hypothetical protein
MPLCCGAACSNNVHCLTHTIYQLTATMEVRDASDMPALSSMLSTVPFRLSCTYARSTILGRAVGRWVSMLWCSGLLLIAEPGGLPQVKQ